MLRDGDEDTCEKEVEDERENIDKIMEATSFIDSKVEKKIDTYT